jgi:hypothetical protein
MIMRMEDKYNSYLETKMVKENVIKKIKILIKGKHKGK